MRYFALVMVVALSLACGDTTGGGGSTKGDAGHVSQDAGADGGEDAGLAVRSVTVTPDTIGADEVDDVLFEVDISHPAAPEVVSASAFIEATGRELAGDWSVVDDDTVRIVERDSRWFSGIIPGTYEIGVSVQTARPDGSPWLETIVDAATVTLEP